MSEFDSVILNNTTTEDFVHNFNGEPYTLPAESSRAFSKFVAFHLAKHLATKLVEADISEDEKKKNPSVVTQRTVYDNPQLRIALYKILKDTKLVQDVIMAYPYKGFVGEMSIYQDYVEKSTRPAQDASARQ
jgi:hypothetical protein